MSEEWTLKLPDDVSRELESLDESRVNTVVSEALRDALDLAESAEDRRDELRERMGLSGTGVEELDESLSEAEGKQAELRDKMGPR